MSEVILTSGGRKTARARLRLRPGTGKIWVNGKRPLEYFKREDLIIHAFEPLKVVQKESDFDVVVKVEGGGLSGQAGAIRYALSRALVKYNEGFKAVLKSRGMLTRDSREKERMKYGLTKRRRAHQYSKR
ncbi:MAG: 30S ribosomal protein S9 [Candidatus Hydrothermales bacterium]